ncbi:MAG: hypothetical protein IJ433_04965 [Ruminococcus sp.]|nr:hypothetical protein [Ruminococcus sp.]
MGRKLMFTTDNNINVEAYLTEGDYLRIKCSIKDEEINEYPFNLKKEPKDAKIIESDKTAVGDFFIVKNENGYTLLDKNENPVYKSEIEISYDKNGTFVAIENTWDRVGFVQELVEKRTYFGQYKFMGMGEAADTLTLNNNSFKLYHTADLGNQAQLYIPFYFTNTGYAVYYNANGNDSFSFTDDSVTYTTKQLYFDCYMFVEATPKKVVSRFYDFSSSKSLMPQWTFGYIQSKFGYQNEQEIYELLEQIDKHNLKVSAIVIDLHWYKRMGDLDWNRENFPHYEEMIKELKKRNIKLLTISQPFFTCESKNYKELDENDVFAKRTKEVTKPQTAVWGDWWCRDDLYGSVINPLSENAEKILGKKYVEMKEKGVDGFWLDLGEPENVPPQVFFNSYSEEEFHLHFAHEWIKIIHGAVTKAYPDYRMFVLSRCGFTGTPGMNVSIWSGDSSATFTNLKKQVLLGINSGITGYSYWGSDAGGFLSQLKLPNEEVYTRWMQFASFTPMFRTHGKKTPREPWCFEGKTTDICCELINMRNNLMPYIYSSSYSTYKNGVPMMRAMYMEHPDDEKCFDISDQFYFGDNLLVAPVFTSMNETTKRDVYLPDGLWYDFNTLEPVKGGSITVDVTMDNIPVFLKEGSVTVTEKEIIVTESVDGKGEEFIWYIDDGETNNYLKGEFEEISLKLNGTTLEVKNVKNDKTVNIKFVTTKGEIRTRENVILSVGNNYIEL